MILGVVLGVQPFQFCACSCLVVAVFYYATVVIILCVGKPTLGCHRHSVAHRYLKPQNLLLDAIGDLKVFDFGLSAFTEHFHDKLLHIAYGPPPSPCRRSSAVSTTTTRRSMSDPLALSFTTSSPTTLTSLTKYSQKLFSSLQ